jgi:hypothetical protein
VRTRYKQSTGGAVQGSINLDESTVLPTDKSCEFKIQDPLSCQSDEFYCFRAETDSEHAQWVTSLKLTTGQDTRPGGDAVAEILDRAETASSSSSRRGSGSGSGSGGATMRQMLARRGSGMVTSSTRRQSIADGLRTQEAAGKAAGGAGGGDTQTLAQSMADIAAAAAAEGPSIFEARQAERDEMEGLGTEAEVEDFNGQLTTMGLPLVVHARNGDCRGELITLQNIKGRTNVTWGGRLAERGGRVGGIAMPLAKAQVSESLSPLASGRQRRASALAASCFLSLYIAPDASRPDDKGRSAVFEAPDCTARDRCLRCFRSLIKGASAVDSQHAEAGRRRGSSCSTVDPAAVAALGAVGARARAPSCGASSGASPQAAGTGKGQGPTQVQLRAAAWPQCSTRDSTLQ